MYLIVIQEVNNSIYLFGKFYCDLKKQFISCSIQITNILRVLFFVSNLSPLPILKGTEQWKELQNRMYEEIDQVRKKYGIMEFKAKLVERNLFHLN